MDARNVLALCAVALALVVSPLGAESKPIIAVLDLRTDQVSENEMKTIISLLSSAMLDTGRYTVIDVAERETLLKEQEFSAQDCTDEKCHIEIGKLLAAEFVVPGRLGKVGSKYVLSVKMLETATSRTVGTADGTYPALDQVLGDMSRVAGKLSGGRAKPQVSGRKVVGSVCLAAAAGCATGAAVLIVSGVRQLNGPVAGRTRRTSLRLTDPRSSQRGTRSTVRSSTGSGCGWE